MKNLIIEYNENKCVGTKRCVEVASDFFSFNGNRAKLIGSSKQNDIYKLHFQATEEQVESLIQAAELCPVNVIKIIDQNNEKVLVSTEIVLDNLRIIKAEYDDLKEFVMDPKGYFLIRIDHKEKVIEVGLCKEVNKVAVKVTGEKPLEIYQTIIKNRLISRFDHAAYLGRELQKAYIALQKGISYVQDDELVL